MAYKSYSRQNEAPAYLKLNDDLKSRVFRPVYLFYGDEDYLKISYKRAFRKVFGGEDGMAYTCFSGAPDVEGLIDLLNTPPFSLDPALGRLVIVEGSDWFKRTPPDRIIDYLSDQKHYPDFAHLVFIESTVDKRSKLYKVVQQAGFPCDMFRQSRADLSRWAARYLQNAGKKIRQSTMERFLEKTGDDMYNIASELDKLIAYTGTRDVIEDEDVETISSQNVEDRVFDMITELSLGHTEKAMRYYQDLLMLQEAPMKILALMRRNFNQLLLAKEVKQKGMNEADAVKATGIQPWLLKKLQSQASGYSIAGLEHYIGRCFEYDEAIKSGNLSDQMAVELLLTT